MPNSRYYFFYLFKLKCFFFKFPLPCDVVNVIQQVHVEALVDVFFFFLKSFLYMSYMAAKRLIQDFV